MQRLFQFLYRQRAFLFFIFLEILSVWLIVSYNKYQSAVFFNSSNFIAGQVFSARTNVVEYFKLKEQNRQLAEQNAKLLGQVKHVDTLKPQESEWIEDTLAQYSYTPAKVVYNSLLSLQSDNYITLNKGEADGVRKDMGVIGPEGVVGKVKNTSEHFSTVTTLLHSRMSVSVRIKNKNIDATVEWPGIHPGKAELNYVMRHHKVVPGDTVITSEYNAIFPEGVMVGVIEEVNLPSGSPDYQISIDLSTDFSRLPYVYVVENKLKLERDSLQAELNVEEK